MISPNEFLKCFLLLFLMKIIVIDVKKTLVLQSELLYTSMSKLEIALEE